MQRLHKQVTPISTTNRSRVTNGTRLLQGIDGRSPAARRFRDLVRAYEAEFNITSESDKTMIRTAAMLTLKAEEMQAAVVRGERAEGDDIVRTAGYVRRVLSNLRRRADAHAPERPVSRCARPAGFVLERRASLPWRG
jgi:hypothetical protein